MNNTDSIKKYLKISDVPSFNGNYKKGEDVEKPLWNVENDEIVDVEDKRAMTLEEHDRIYHKPNGYEWDHEHNGTRCYLRESMERGDDADKQVQAERKEGTNVLERTREVERLEKDAALMLAKTCPKYFRERSPLKAYTAIKVTPQDKNNDIELHVWAPDFMNEDIIGEADARRFAKRNEYEFKGMKELKMPNKHKKCYVVRMHKDARVGGYADEDGRKAAAEKYLTLVEYPELTDGEKSVALRKYGYKVENGKVMKRQGPLDIPPEELRLREDNTKWLRELNREKSNKETIEQRKRDKEAKNEYLASLLSGVDDFVRKM